MTENLHRRLDPTPAHRARLGKLAIAVPKSQQHQVAHVQGGTIALSPTHLPLSLPSTSHRFPQPRNVVLSLSIPPRLGFDASPLAPNGAVRAREGAREKSGRRSVCLDFSPMGGKQIPDVCGPLSLKEKMQADKKGATCYTGMKYRICCVLLVALPFLLFLVFLSLYLQFLFSISAREMKKCQMELQNRTSHMQANLDGLGKRVEEKESDLEKARAERDGLRAELAVANWSLAKAREDWGSCQGELKSLEKNATSQVKEAVQREMEKNKVAEEEIKQLKQQLYNLQQTEEQQQKKIQHLEDQLMKHKPLERSEGGLLLGPSVVLLPLLLAVLLL